MSRRRSAGAPPVRTLVAAGLAAVAVGCGTGDDERDARRVAERFNAAIERGDGAAACAQLTEEAASTVEEEESSTCAQGVLKLGLTPSPVDGVEVVVDNGRVDLEGGDALFLDDTAGGWRISAAGCSPRRQTPYDCELEA